MPLKITTTMSDKKDAELVQLHEKENNYEALKELLIRRVNEWVPHFKKQDAIALCDKQINAMIPDPFFRLIRGMLGTDAEKQLHLRLAAQCETPGYDATVAEAARQLARFHYANSQYIQCRAWLARALLKGSQQAQEDFMGIFGHGVPTDTALSLRTCMPRSMLRTANEVSFFDRPTMGMQALDLATYLAVHLTDQHVKFYALAYRKWMVHWCLKLGDHLVNAHYVDRANARHAVLNNPSSSMYFIANVTAWADPFLYVRFFKYAAEMKIVPQDIFIIAMQFMLMYTPDPKHSPEMKQEILDTCHFELGCYYLTATSQKQDGFACLQQISAKFTGYDASAFSLMNDQEKMECIPSVIQIISAKNQSPEVKTFLAALQTTPTRCASPSEDVELQLVIEASLRASQPQRLVLMPIAETPPAPSAPLMQSLAQQSSAPSFLANHPNGMFSRQNTLAAETAGMFEIPELQGHRWVRNN